MAQTLRINEKEYLPSTELAKRFSYTSDYISKLAREEKVLATRVGRQWFIEPESLRLYIQQLEIEKKISQEKLSRQRKIERGQGVSATKAHSPQTTKTLAQAMVVMLLWSAVSALGWGVVASDLSVRDLAHGAHVVYVAIEDQVSAGVSVAVSGVLGERSVASPLWGSIEEGFESQTVVDAALVGPQSDQVGVYAVLPDISAGTTTQGQVLGDQVTSLHFSDEVVMTKDDGGLRVQPVFRDSVGSSFTIGSTSNTERGRE